MLCLGFEPETAVWKAQTIPLSYGGLFVYFCSFQSTKHVPFHNSVELQKKGYLLKTK